MNKKFLSAVLFGALMVTSTGTFVSCKDYDDDIKDLQTQINSNKDAIAALQKLVGEGNWVTGITSIADGFTVTMSNGQSTTITGIKGEDGKNGVEWTIGDDGFWYKDGEKTAHQAVAKDGKPGVTAPSPSISADGKWVVYEWDATKGEFVAKTTEIPAQGTSAYVVKKDGVYVLHIADETGAFQDVTLPATSDAFVVEAPMSEVVVRYETATWNKWNANKEESKTLLKKYPELAEIAKNTPMQQGGNLPILVTPANVELSDDFSFSLQNANGKIADVKVSTPVKGLPVNTSIKTHTVWFDLNGNDQIDKGEIKSVGAKYMETRAASNDCFWAVKAEPAYDEKKKEYAEANNVSLVATNPAGTTVKTAFAYTVSSVSVGEELVSVYVSNTNVEYASSIDVFTPQKEDVAAIFTVVNDYAGKYVLELTNKLQIEKYELSVDGSKIVIGNMPANENAISIDMKVTVLGLNGSVGSQSATITVTQGVNASVSLDPKTATLSKDAVKVRWNMSDLEKMMSAVQLDQMMNGTVKFFISRVDDDTQKKYVAYDKVVKFYDAKNREVTYNNGKWYYNSTESAAVTFGFDLNAKQTVAGNEKLHNGEKYTEEMWMPKEYTVEMTSTSTNGTTVIFSAETTLTVSNPDATTYIKLVPAFVEGGVYQITGNWDDKAASGMVTYNLKEAFILGENATLKSFVDLDAKNYIAEGGDLNDATEYARYNWLKQAQITDENADLDEEGELVPVDASSAKLYVNKWAKATSTNPAAKVQQLYHERNMCAYYYLFGNSNNVIPFPFKVKVKSEIYSETPKDVIVMDDAKLTAVFDPENKDNRTINIQDAITKALVAAGTDRGQEYALYASPGKQNEYDVYANGPKYNGEYVVTSTGKPIAISADDLMDFGMTMDQYIAYTSMDTKPTYYLKKNTVVYYNDNEYISKEAATTVAQNAAVAALGENPEEDKVTKAKADAAADVVAKAVEIYGWNDTLYPAYAKYYTLDVVKGVYELNKRVVESADKIPAADATLISLFNTYNKSTVFDTAKGTQAQDSVEVDGRLSSAPVISFADATEAAKYFKNVASNGVVSGVAIEALEKAPADVTSGKVTVPMKLTITDRWNMVMVREFNVVVTTN